jgi:hypothetical protein
MSSSKRKFVLIGLAVLIAISFPVWSFIDKRREPVLLASFQFDEKADTPIAVSPDGKILAVGGLGIKLWNVIDRNEKVLFVGKEVYSIAFSPDGRILACGDADGEIRFWNWEEGKELAISKDEDSSAVWSMAFTVDGKCLATTGKGNAPGSADAVTRPGSGEVNLWDVATGKLKATLGGHKCYLVAVAISPDGTTLASADGHGYVKLWDTATWKEKATLAGSEGGDVGIAFSPNSKTLASSAGGRVQLWDVATGSLQARLVGRKGEIRCLSFSPDGKHLVAGCGNPPMFWKKYGHAEIWDVETKRLISTWKATDGWKVSSCVFIPETHSLATGSGDGIRRWDIGGL